MNASLIKIKAETEKEVRAMGLEWSEEIWKRAKGKAERWMRAAFGGVDWDSGEMEGSITVYYKESIEKSKPGDATHNRQCIAGSSFNRNKSKARS